MCCNPVFSEFNELLANPSVTVSGRTYGLDLFFNGDMNFIQLSLGFIGSSAIYACPWYHVSKDERTYLSKDADYYDSPSMKRTAGTLKHNVEKKKFGSKEVPLVSISPDKIIPYELHLLLRVSDVLLQNIIDDCRQMDALATAQKKSADHLDRLVRALNEIGIHFQIWNDGSGLQQYTSLSGNDCKQLFDTLPPQLLFALNNDTYDDTVFLMRKLLSIHKLITNSFTNKSHAFSRIKRWMERFTGLNNKQRVGYNRVTPYMRCLLYHVPKFASLYNGIGSFSGQGVEKIKDQIKFIH